MSKSLSHTINEKYQIWVANHMTHFDNLRPILQAKELRSYNLMSGQNYRNLANDDVQAGRAAVTIPVSQRPLHDYVPLYLGFKTPMVATNQLQNENLLFLRFSLDILSTPGAIVSDGNARSQKTQFYLFSGPDIFSKNDFVDLSDKIICSATPISLEADTDYFSRTGGGFKNTSARIPPCTVAAKASLT